MTAGDLETIMDEWAGICRKILVDTARAVRRILHRHSMVRELAKPHAWKYYSYYMGVGCGVIKQRKCKARMHRKAERLGRIEKGGIKYGEGRGQVERHPGL